MNLRKLTRLTSIIQWGLHVMNNGFTRHEQVGLIRLRFERYFSYHREKKMIMSHIFKGNMRTRTETIKLMDKKKLCDVAY